MGDEIESWTSGSALEASVARADRSLEQSLYMVLGAAALAGAAVYVGYARGHGPTVKLVGKARAYVREFLDTRGGRGPPLAEAGARGVYSAL